VNLFPEINGLFTMLYKKRWVGSSLKKKDA
jgi:hypothetical protein